MKKEKSAKRKKIAKRIIAVLLVLIICVSINGYVRIIPHMAVINDAVSLGLDYIDLNIYKDAPSKSELKDRISKLNNDAHPFILVNESNFDTVRREIKENRETEYTKALTAYVMDNANALLDTSIYPPLEYVLDEEDSILPISREVFNRIVILGYAWQLTSNDAYAERAWQELETVCAYEDWCPGHFLATAEMALAVATGYDWFYDYLSESQLELLSQTTYDFAIKPALSKNYLSNWFTWSKNNWNSICYSGIGIACMTFAERYPDAAAEFLHMCYQNMPIAFENFTPDGVYAEGSGYCQSGMNAIAYFIATSKNLFGTDFGISEIDGFKQLGYFPVYITTPTGVFNFGDNQGWRCYTPVLHWYASEYNTPLLAAYQMQDFPYTFYPDSSDNTERNGEGKENALSSLWYNRAFTGDTADFSDEPLSVCLESDTGEALTLMRSAYLDENAVFAGIKGGYNYTNHGDLDIGSFVYDALGERWAEELGRGNYDAPGYFVNLPAGGRWKNYCKRAEGQNTLVINPQLTTDDQYALARCGFSSFDASSNSCSLDMTDAYSMNGASSVNRAFSLDTDSSALTITDNIKCLWSSDIYWFMHTRADIEIVDEKTAILTKNDKQIKATLPNDGTFSVMETQSLKASSLPYDPETQDDAQQNAGEMKKLTVHLEDVRTADICVVLEPIG
ncbi:MAG: DUF4962 domain-containing protein [Clostridium sp.]|nr:DUF4962 domain-containing protein [Clostridium sp.]